MLNQALGSSSSPSRILRASAIGSSGSGRDGEQVADGGRRVVGPDQVLADQDGVGAGVGGRLGDGVDLDQGVQAGPGGLVQQGAQGRRVNGGDDQQDGVGAPGARLPHLIGVADEVFAEHGQLD